MKNTLILSCILAMAMVLHSAPVDTLTPAQMASTTMTVEQLLNVPATYTVTNCRLMMSNKDKGVGIFFYCRDATGGCANINAKGFPARWATDLHRWLLDGYNFVITDIEMQRGSKTMHWQQKSFAARR